MRDHVTTELSVVASRFRGVADDWALDEADTASLLGIAAAAVPAAVQRGEGLDETAETRMRHAIDVAGAARRLLARDEPSAAWIRCPNPALFGRTPLEVMIGEPRGLAAIRHRLLSELGDGLG